MKEAAVFQNGGSQAIRIPKEMRLDSDKVLIEKVGGVVVILDGNDPWASVKLGQVLMAGRFMAEGRELNPIVERKGLRKKSKK